jgi:hypothetical protein
MTGVPDRPVDPAESARPADAADPADPADATTSAEPVDSVAAVGPARHDEEQASERLELIREATTMALYVSLSLLAVLMASPSASHDNRITASLIVFGTAVGLVLAHHLAFRLSTRLVNSGLLTPESVRALKAQALGGFPVAVLASVPVLVFGADPGEPVAEVVLLLFVALVGYRAVRASTTPGRALLYVAGLSISVAAVLALKLIVGH